MAIAAPPKPRDALKQVDDDLAALRDARATALKERDSARDAFLTAEDRSQDSPQFMEAQEAVRQVGEIEDQIAAKKSEQVLLLQLMGREEEIADTPKTIDQRPAQGWNSANLLAADGMREELERISATKSRFGTMQLGEVVDRDTFAADIAPTANMRAADYYGVIPQLRRPIRLLDLLPSATMDGNVLPYTVESGSFAAAETAEGIAKPEDGVTYTDASATAQTIAAWMKIRKQALADAAALRGIIDTRLRYSVLRRLETQIINGNGTDPNLRGIINTSGIGTVADSASELIADQILEGITTVLLADAIADGVLMHPTDWKTVLKAKAAGDGHYYSGGPFSITPQVLWGVPLIASPGVPVGHALVGDFSIGAMLFIREGVQVLFSDSDQDDFIKNRVTLLGEMRAALPVFRPAAFCDVDLAA